MIASAPTSAPGCFQHGWLIVSAPGELALGAICFTADNRPDPAFSTSALAFEGRSPAVTRSCSSPARER